MTGEYFDVDFLDELDTKGLFKSGGRQPKINKLGDWKYGVATYDKVITKKIMIN